LALSGFFVFFVNHFHGREGRKHRDKNTHSNGCFELERSLAILQLSTASLGDYQSLDLKNSAG